ncbi:MAG TPA: LysM peptidoglycan-binding domain-containing protein [Kofleriaceae bacterium]|nr:LysM peptidoglycan-binding domain-containing protein [Kofleriaceae bacterium]
MKPGDTLQLIAAEFYGDRNRAIFIMVENKITHAKPLKPGERLRIPRDREITTSPEDTWETLAGAYLGDPRRAPFLAEFNKMTSEEAVPAGTPLHVPVTVTHTAEATETLASISAAYFGEPKHADMLRRYNFREKMSLEKGESIVIPVFHVRLPESKLPPTDAEAKARQAARRTAASDAVKALPKAWQAWRAGEYAEIETLLSKLNTDYLETESAVEVMLLRGLAHAAEDKGDLALADFQKVRERKQGHVLRKFDYSPKVLEIWEKAGGKVE